MRASRNARHREAGGTLGALAVAIVLLGSVSAAAAQTDADVEVELETGRSELARLGEAIGEAESRIGALRLAEREGVARLRALEQGVDRAEELAVAYTAQESRLAADTARRQAALDATNARLADLRARLASLMDRIYRRGKTSFASILLGAEDFGSVLRRSQYVAKILATERRLVHELDAVWAQQREELAALESRERELTVLRRDQEREHERLARLRSERALALDATQKQRASAEEKLAEMRASAERLGALIASLEKERTEGAESLGPSGLPRTAFDAPRPFGELRGSLTWPLRGEILTTFGKVAHPKYGTETFSSGVDIRAREGQPVVAMGDGQVEFVDWVKGYGKTVIVSHGDGYYSLYAHASAILVAPGDRVRGGTPIAFAGSTDSLLGDCLHVELRKGGQAVDPLPWLARQ